MQILLADVEHARHIGKRLSRVLSVPLTRGYFLAALVLGYRDWNLLLSLSPNAHATSLPDEKCCPLAVRWRREYQARILCQTTGISAERAAAIVERVRPSHGFTYEPSPHRPIPDQANPALSPEDLYGIHESLRYVWDVACRRAEFARPMTAVAHRFDEVVWSEYDPWQFGRIDLHRLYLSLCGQPPRAQKWLQDEQAHRIRASLKAILARLENIHGSSRVAVDGLAAAIERLDAVVDRWHKASRPHMSEPISYIGHPLVHDEIPALLKALGLDPDLDLRTVEIAAWSPRRARAILAALDAAPIGVQQTPVAKYVRATITKGLRTAANMESRVARRRAPMTRSWHICVVNEAALHRIATRPGTTALDAIATAGVSGLGRLVAVPVEPVRAGELT